MEQERRAFAVLRGAVRIDYRGGGVLVLAGNGGILELRRRY